MSEVTPGTTYRNPQRPAASSGTRAPTPAAPPASPPPQQKQPPNQTVIQGYGLYSDQNGYHITMTFTNGQVYYSPMNFSSRQAAQDYLNGLTPAQASNIFQSLQLNPNTPGLYGQPSPPPISGNKPPSIATAGSQTAQVQFQAKNGSSQSASGSLSTVAATIASTGVRYVNGQYQVTLFGPNGQGQTFYYQNKPTQADIYNLLYSGQSFSQITVNGKNFSVPVNTSSSNQVMPIYNAVQSAIKPNSQGLYPVVVDGQNLGTYATLEAANTALALYLTGNQNFKPFEVKVNGSTVTFTNTRDAITYATKNGIQQELDGSYSVNIGSGGTQYFNSKSAAQTYVRQALSGQPVSVVQATNPNTGKTLDFMNMTDYNAWATAMGFNLPQTHGALWATGNWSKEDQTVATNLLRVTPSESVVLTHGSAWATGNWTPLDTSIMTNALRITPSQTINLTHGGAFATGNWTPLDTTVALNAMRIQWITQPYTGFGSSAYTQQNAQNTRNLVSTFLKTKNPLFLFAAVGGDFVTGASQIMQWGVQTRNAGVQNIESTNTNWSLFGGKQTNRSLAGFAQFTLGVGETLAGSAMTLGFSESSPNAKPLPKGMWAYEDVLKYGVPIAETLPLFVGSVGAGVARGVATGTASGVAKAGLRVGLTNAAIMAPWSAASTFVSGGTPIQVAESAVVGGSLGLALGFGTEAAVPVARAISPYVSGTVRDVATNVPGLTELVTGVKYLPYRMVGASVRESSLVAPFVTGWDRWLGFGEYGTGASVVEDVSKMVGSAGNRVYQTVVPAIRDSSLVGPFVTGWRDFLTTDTGATPITQEVANIMRRTVVNPLRYQVYPAVQSIARDVVSTPENFITSSLGVEKISDITNPLSRFYRYLDTSQIQGQAALRASLKNVGVVAKESVIDLANETGVPKVAIDFFRGLRDIPSEQIDKNFANEIDYLGSKVSRNVSKVKNTVTEPLQKYGILSTSIEGQPGTWEQFVELAKTNKIATTAKGVATDLKIRANLVQGGWNEFLNSIEGKGISSYDEFFNLMRENTGATRGFEYKPGQILEGDVPVGYNIDKDIFNRPTTSPKKITSPPSNVSSSRSGSYLTEMAPEVESNPYAVSESYNELVNAGYTPVARAVGWTGSLIGGKQAMNNYGTRNVKKSGGATLGGLGTTQKEGLKANQSINTIIANIMNTQPSSRQRQKTVPILNTNWNTNWITRTRITPRSSEDFITSLVTGTTTDTTTTTTTTTVPRQTYDQVVDTLLDVGQSQQTKAPLVKKPQTTSSIFKELLTTTSPKSTTKQRTKYKEVIGPVDVEMFFGNGIGGVLLGKSPSSRRKKK